MEEEEEEELEEEAEEEYDEEGRRKPAAPRSSSRRGKGKGQEAAALGRAARMEPALAKEHFLMPEDERVRREDMPERMAVGPGGDAWLGLAGLGLG